MKPRAVPFWASKPGILQRSGIDCPNREEELSRQLVGFLDEGTIRTNYLPYASRNESGLAPFWAWFPATQDDVARPQSS